MRVTTICLNDDDAVIVSKLKDKLRATYGPLTTVGLIRLALRELLAATKKA